MYGFLKNNTNRQRFPNDSMVERQLEKRKVIDSNLSLLFKISFSSMRCLFSHVLERTNLTEIATESMHVNLAIMLLLYFLSFWPFNPLPERSGHL